MLKNNLIKVFHLYKKRKPITIETMKYVIASGTKDEKAFIIETGSPIKI